MNHLPRFIHAVCILLLVALPGFPGIAQAACDPSKECCFSGGGAGSTCGGSDVASQGNDSGTNIGAGNPINVITGNKFQREVDMAPLPGVLGLEIVRYYNSAQNRNGFLGRGWLLSYETQLHTRAHGVEIEQADGTKIMFVENAADRDLYTGRYPAQGSVHASRGAHGMMQHTWTWADGRTLYFDVWGRLHTIQVPSGEFVSLHYDDKSWLYEVVDPAGRTLRLHYLDKDTARRNDRFKGVQNIDTPVGRFTYEYGGEPPQGSRVTKADLIPNLIRVNYPTHYDAEHQPEQYAGRGTTTSTISRLYHYEDGRFPGLLTGITVQGTGSDNQLTSERINTWAYDSARRGILSIKGERPKQGAGVEQVSLQWLPGGTTLLTNSLGQQTVYTTATITGQPRLLQVRGAGCSTCGPSNMRYGYDQYGLLADETTLDADGKPLKTTHTERDGYGRPLKVSTITYANGKPQSPQWQVRYEYALAEKTKGEPSPNPTLIARPSVMPGQEHQTRITYNKRGQPTQITESGFSPVDDKDQPAPKGYAISRTTTYAYVEINGRSMFASVDGPLPNGPKGDPTDSDITTYAWDKRADYMTGFTRPGNLNTGLTRDRYAGRVVKATDPSGVTIYRYDAAYVDRPSDIERGGQATHYAFDTLGRVSRVGDGVRSIVLAYDAASHLVSVTDAQGYKAQTTLDTEGLPRIAGLYEPGQDKPLRATYRWFDEQRRLIRQLRPDGRLDSWSYDGQDVQHIDGDDVLNVTRRNAQGWQADLQLTADGLMRAKLAAPTPNSGGRALTDDLGRTVFAWRPEQGVSITRYDAADHPMHVQLLGTDAKPAGTVAAVFDNAGRLLNRTTSDPAGKTTQMQRRYEADKLVEESDDTQFKRFAYDAQGRVSETSITLKDEQGQAIFTTTLATSYDPKTGEPITRTLADQRVMRIERDPKTGVARTIALQGSTLASLREHLPDFLRSWVPKSTVLGGLTFHPFNGIASYAHANGITTYRGFDIAGRLTALKVGQLSDQTLSYQVGPRIRGIEDKASAFKTSYDYEGFGALKQEPNLVRTSTEPTERDTLGRAASDEHLRYTYTASGQIETVSNREGKLIAKYRYNAAGQRGSKTVQEANGAKTTNFLWHDGRLVAEIEGAGEHRGEVTAQYLYLTQGGQVIPIAKLESERAQGNTTGSARVLYIHADHRGQPLAMTDEAKHVVWRGRGDAWGFIEAQQLQGSQAALNLRLPGQYFDAETGLHDNWHRSYDARPGSATHGTYLQPDPMGYPNGPDPYVYVGGDPINCIDPLGLYQEDVHYYMT